MSNRLIQYIIYLFLFLIPVFSGISLFASGYSVTDSSQVVVRQPDSKFIDLYRSKKEFTYISQPLFETNFLKHLIEYLKNRFIGLKRFSNVIALMFKVLVGGILVLILFIVITKTKLYKLFYTNKGIENPEFAFSNPDDQTTNFDEAIRLHIAQQHYRIAIRLLYIQVISMLRSNEYIHFSKEKTNVDYLSDLTNEDLKSQFYQITSIYNHVWYGDVEIAEDQFLRFEKSFQSFYSLINVQE